MYHGVTFSRPYKPFMLFIWNELGILLEIRMLSYFFLFIWILPFPKVWVSLYRVILAIRPISGTQGCTSPNFGGGTRAEAYEAQCGSRYHSVSNGYWTGVQREWLEMKSGFRISQVYHFRLWFCPWSEAKADGAPSLP